MEQLKESLESLYRRADDLTAGRLGILTDALNGFNDAKGGDVAAAMAYYTMFSLFPMLLALIAAGSFFLEAEQVQREVVRIVTQAVPISEELIRSNVDQVLDNRGTIGLVGLVGLLWSGTGVFTVLLGHVNLAWAGAERRGFLERRLLGLGVGVLGILAVVLMLLLLSTPLLNLLPGLGVAGEGWVAALERPLWILITKGAPPLLGFLIFTALYRWAPKTDVRWSEAIWPALFVALIFEVAQRGFAWYVSSDLVQYRLVYGSLGAVVALLLWIYLVSMFLLFGAHLSAAIARSRG